LARRTRRKRNRKTRIDSQDIKEIILNSDTIVYMAEFFTECINKIISRLGPNMEIISKVDTYLKTDNKEMYQKIIGNSFDEHSSVDIHIEKDNIIALFSVLHFYYGCTSLVNLGEIHLSGISTADMMPNLFKIITDNCPNIIRL
jgi:hypothetical protein